MISTIQTITEKLNDYFSVRNLSNDPQMGMFIPMVYDSIGFDWKNFFEEDFVFRKNGLMIRGEEAVGNIHLAAFPTPHVLEKFFSSSKPGDLFFSHHAIYTLNGDPKNDLGKGWQPIDPILLHSIKEKGLSYYSCHSPMDYHPYVGTRSAMLQALGAVFLDDFFFDDAGPHGAICTVPPVSINDLREKLLTIFDIPYLDEGGVLDGERIVTKVAIIAGGADNSDYQKQAEENGVEAYICGEFNSNFDTEWARGNQILVDEFTSNTSMTMLAVSHAASEFLTMRTQMQYWFSANFPGVNVKLIEQEKWWF